MEYNKPGQLKMEGNLNENFKIFKQDLEIYFEATETNKKDMRVQTARLLNLMGKEALKKYNTLEISKKESPTVQDILDALEKCCLPKKNEIMEHYKFFKRHQYEGETFDHYRYYRLKSASEIMWFW